MWSCLRQVAQNRLNDALRLGITPNSQAGHQPFRLVTELPAHLRRIYDACKRRGELRAGMGEPTRADPNFKDHTGMVNCATVFDEVLERSLEDLASSLLV